MQYQRSRPKHKRARIQNMVWDQPPQPVVPTTAPAQSIVAAPTRPGPALYNADTGQPLGGRMQRWASGFLLPGQPTVKVRLGRLPTASQEPAGVTYDEKLGEDVMYIDPTYFTRKNFHRKELQTAARQTMYDELTHLYDRSGRLTDETKQRFQQIMGDTRPWRGGPNAPNEQFSEASLGYSMGYTRASPRWTGGYDFSPTQTQWNQIRLLFGGLK